MSHAIPLEPLFDRVILKLKEPETKTAGGILLTESASEKPTRGEVVAVGPGKRTEGNEVIPLTVKIGDQVVFSSYSPESITIDGVEYYIIREESILAVIK